MMRRFLLFLALASICLAQREQFLGFSPAATAPAMSTTAVNAAGTWLAIGFVAKRPGTVHLSNFWIFASARNLGLASGTYTSGGSITGTVGQTCNLATFNNGGAGMTATVALTGTNVIAGGTAITVTAAGTTAGAAPTSATLSSGTATCSGTATLSTVLSTFASTDFTADLFTDVNGVPGASVESRNTVTPAAAGNTWLEFTGFTSTSALVQNTQYWIVLKNVNATPASNYLTYQFGGAGSANGNTAAYWGSQKVGTVDSGTTWATAATLNIVGYRLDFDDGTFQGQAISAVATDATKVNSTTKLGFYTVTPQNATLNVSGMSLMFRKVGAPSGNAVLELFNGTTQIATCSIPLTDVNTTASRMYSCYWTAIQVVAGTTLRGSVSISAAGGDASNYIQFSVSEYTTETSAGSLAQLPFGNWQKTSYNGSTWTETNSTVMIGGIILDPTGEFGSSGTCGTATSICVN